MQKIYKLKAEPCLIIEGPLKGHLQTVTFIACSDSHSFRWWSVNTATLVKDFQKIVSPELAIHIVEQLRAGETVEFPNRYEFEQVKGGFGARWND
jgi:hypothetical protein